MPKVSDAYLDAQRERILDASLRTFARLGFHRATIQDVCRTAGMSHGALYRYYPTKEDLVQAVAEKLRSDFMGGFEAAGAAPENMSLAEVLASLAPGSHAWLDAPDAAEYLAISLQWWAEATTNGAVRRALVDGFFNVWRDALAQIMERAQHRGEVASDVDPTALSRVLLSLYYGLVLQKALDPSVDVAGYDRATKLLLANALGGSSP